MSDHLFVFGTLLGGYDHPMARRLAREAEWLGAAHCAGRLYLVKHYPGMIQSGEPADRVFGELYRLRDAAVLLSALDDYEGCGENDAEPTEFVRQRVTVTLGSGMQPARSIEAWTYRYNRPVENLPRIASGRFLQH